MDFGPAVMTEPTRDELSRWRNIEIPVYEPELSGREEEYVTACIRSGWISGIGSYVKRFEDSFSAYCGVPYGVATCNGTVALDLALAALGVGRGDEVIAPNLTFAATANAIRHLGAEPVFVDSESHTWNLDPHRIEAAITPRTKAIIVVHLYGHPADMDPIIQIAEDHGLFVIEDAAEAHGALYKQQRVGGLGHVACFSFYANKIITTGEGGMLITRDSSLAERAQLLKGQAMHPDKYYWHSEVGYNFRMSNLHAAIGVAQLDNIDAIIHRKREVARQYTRLLEGVPGIQLSPEAEWATSVFWMYSVLIRPKTGKTRDQVRQYLLSRGIETRPFFFPMSKLPPFAVFARGDLAVSEDLAREGINLPSSSKLTDAQIEHVATALSEAVTMNI